MKGVCEGHNMAVIWLMAHLLEVLGGPLCMDGGGGPA